MFVLAERKYAWNGITEENGFRDKRLQSVPLGMGQQPCYSLKASVIIPGHIQIPFQSVQAPVELHLPGCI